MCQLCSSYKVFCRKHYFIKRCFLGISIYEPAFRKNFLSAFPVSAQKIIIGKLGSKKHRSIYNLKWTNIYINEIISRRILKAISHSLLVYCKNLRKIELVGNSAALQTMKSPSYRECNKWR